ncbi:MFS transporter [Lentzea alba]|uniref:MFS transporter n=1 Tax=Lentzea alba TaxID=2714351 RepID=UPI0039BF30EE
MISAAKVTNSATVALHCGGFIGLFAGNLPSAMLPEVGRTYGVSSATAAYGLTAFLVPASVLLLWSGTLATRWGAARTTRVAYLIFAAATVVCVVSKSFEVFIAGRFLQGLATAFFSPLLVVALAATTREDRLGRTMARFASTQAAAVTFAPIVGGLAAEASWRIAFAVTAVLAIALALSPVPMPSRPDRGAQPVTLRSALRPAVLRIGLSSLISKACIGGLAFMVALRAEDVFNLGPALRGLVLTGFGLCALLGGSFVGRLVDRLGAAGAAVAGSICGALLVVFAGILPSPVTMAAAWSLAGMAAQWVTVSLSTMSLKDKGVNHAGEVSVVQALRNAGGAAAPVAFAPLYSLVPLAGFAVPAILLATSIPLLLRRR